MNGPEHYREAERIIGMVTEPSGGIHADRDDVIAAAQVHATLALAAALQPAGRAWAEATRFDGTTRDELLPEAGASS